MIEDLLFQCILQILNVLKITGIAGLQSHELSGIGIHAVVQHKLDHLAHVDIAGIGGAVRGSAAGAGLDAAHDSPVTGLLQGAALAHGHLHGHIVIEEAGVCLPLLDHFAALADQLLRCAVPDTDSHNGLGGLELIGRLQADIGQFIGRVLALRGLAADDQKLPHGIPGKGGGIPAVPHLKHLAGLQIEALQQFQGLIGGQVLFLQHILLVKRPHILVKTAESVGGGADLNVEVHMDKPHKLHSLLEGLRRILRDNAAVFGNGQQFPSALLIRAAGSLAFRFLCHAAGIGDQTLALDDAGLPEIDALLVCPAGAQGIFDIAPALVHVTLQAHSQQLFMVAGGFAGNAVGQAHRDDVVIHQLHRMGRQRGLGNVLHGLALPIGQRFADQLPVLGCNIVGILFAHGEFIQLIHIELGAGLELGVQVGAEIFIGRRADDQLIVHDERRHVLHNIAHHLGAENRHRVPRELLIGLCLQHQPLRRNAGAGAKQFLTHSAQSLIQHSNILPV